MGPKFSSTGLPVRYVDEFQVVQEVVVNEVALACKPANTMAAPSTFAPVGSLRYMETRRDFFIRDSSAIRFEVSASEMPARFTQGNK